MKKILIVYAVMFALTILIPAIICFTDTTSGSQEELVTIFRQQISLIGCYH
ncbi:MAG: hypothetical protein J1E36_00930 [Eubacterium sp.]|nr:hypothetical protein [Eubacterium sp.]